MKLPKTFCETGLAATWPALRVMRVTPPGAASSRRKWNRVRVEAETAVGLGMGVTFGAA